MAFWNRKKNKDKQESDSSQGSSADKSAFPPPFPVSGQMPPPKQPKPETAASKPKQAPKFSPIPLSELRGKFKGSLKEKKGPEASQDESEEDVKIEGSTSKKSRLVATVLCGLLGTLGAHRLYVGRTRSGIAMILTLGGLGVWALIDLAMLMLGKFQDSDGNVLLNWDFSLGSGTLKYGLIIRRNQVECVSMKGTQLNSLQVVPFIGELDQALAPAIQQAVSGVHLLKQKVAVAIPTEEVLFRFFSIPEMPKGEWEAAIKFEARKYIPFKTEALVWDYHVHPSPENHRLDIVFMAIQRQSYESIVNALRDAGITPAWIEPSTLSLARLVTPVKDAPPEDFTCLINISDESAHIAIIKDGDPYLARDVSLAPRADIVAVDDAKEALEEQIAPETVPPGTDSRLGRLLNELSVSIDFLVREYPSAQVQRVLLFGDEALVKSWYEEIKLQCQCAVEMGDVVLPSDDEAISLSQAVAFGLLDTRKDARKGAVDFQKRVEVKSSPSVGNIQLNKSTFNSEQLAQTIKTPQTLVFGILSIGFLIAIGLVSSQWSPNAQKELQALIAQGQQTDSILGGLTKGQIDSVRGEIQQQVSTLQRLINNRVRFAEKLNAIAMGIPNGVWLTSLSYDNRMERGGVADLKLLVDGACFLGEPAQELVAIQKFEQQVKQDSLFASGFSSMRVQQINAEVSQNGNFNYRTFQLECKS